MISFQSGPEGMGVLTIELPPSNRTWTNLLETELSQKLEEALHTPAIQSLLIMPERAEPGVWIEGLQYDELLRLQTPAEVLKAIQKTQTLFRTLEKNGKPVAIILSGSLMGRGLEFALACHYRVMVNHPAVRVGFPDIRFGLGLGAGGVQRLVRKIGLQSAIPFLLKGASLTAEAAFKLGLVDAVAHSRDELVNSVKKWLLAKPEALQPWDKKGFRLPGGEVYAPHNQLFWAGTNANLRKQMWGHFWGRDLLLASLYEGAQVSFDRALEIEAQYFAQSSLSAPFRASLKTLYFSKCAADGALNRPKDIPKKLIKTVGILGAGMMGKGIALVAAGRGLNVVLLDANLKLAEEGKAYAATYYDKQIAEGKANIETKQAVLARIQATEQYEDLASCDGVIEAVSENRKIKTEVMSRAKAVMKEDALLASNTSTLPITSLAKPLPHPEQFIGLHFFSPVERMPLLEIIKGKQTSEEALAWALDFSKQMGKTPIVVNDGRGFFTSRVFEKYILEGLTMLQEGVKPALIENAARLAGMPVGPLALADEVSLGLIHQILKQTREDLGNRYVAHPAEGVIERFVGEFSRPGKKAGKGLYEYPPQGKKYLWPLLSQHYPEAQDQPEVELLKYRLLFIQSLEAIRCMEEGIITDKADADLGSVLGLGFPAWTGGVIGYLEGLGYSKSLEICKRLSKMWGERFKASRGLKKFIRGKGEVM